MAELKVISKKYNDSDILVAEDKDVGSFVDPVIEGNTRITKRYEVSNIQSISNEILDKLKVGDIVAKITGNAKHSYRVSYKGTGAGSGICLTYVDCGYMETVSYDRSGSGWVYNSTDVCKVNDKDVISKIEVSYDEDDNSTTFYFPESILPLSISLNTHSLYFKDDKLVDENGDEVVGYELQDFAIEEEEQVYQVYITVGGDHSDEVINNLTYIEYSGGAYIRFIYDTYSLFFPSTPSGGTKLYRHALGDLTMISLSELPPTDYSLSGLTENQVLRAVYYRFGSAKPVIKWSLDFGETTRIAFTYYDIVENAIVLSTAYTPLTDTVTPL